MHEQRPVFHLGNSLRQASVPHNPECLVQILQEQSRYGWHQSHQHPSAEWVPPPSWSDTNHELPKSERSFWVLVPKAPNAVRPNPDLQRWSPSLRPVALQVSKSSAGNSAHYAASSQSLAPMPVDCEGTAHASPHGAWSMHSQPSQSLPTQLESKRLVELELLQNSYSINLGLIVILLRKGMLELFRPWQPGRGLDEAPSPAPLEKLHEACLLQPAKQQQSSLGNSTSAANDLRAVHPVESLSLQRWKAAQRCVGHEEAAEPARPAACMPRRSPFLSYLAVPFAFLTAKLRWGKMRKQWQPQTGNKLGSQANHAKLCTRISL